MLNNSCLKITYFSKVSEILDRGTDRCFFLPRCALLDCWFKRSLLLVWAPILPAKTLFVVRKEKPTWRPESCLWEKQATLKLRKRGKSRQPHYTSIGHSRYNNLEFCIKARIHWFTNNLTSNTSAKKNVSSWLQFSQCFCQETVKECTNIEAMSQS